MNACRIAIISLVLLLASSAAETLQAAGTMPTSRAAYREFIERTAEFHMRESQNNIENWKQNIKKSNLFGYSPSSYAASAAVLMGYMYQETGDEKYAAKAADLLLQYEDFKKIYPKEFYEDRIEYKKGLPPISNFFHMNDYPEAWLYIKNSPKISAKARKIIEKGISDCANFLLNYPEWGPMNRSILRAEVCLYAAKALPDHPDAPEWRQMAEVLSSDSYQRWEEEDASGYHPVWLLSLFRFVDGAGDASFFKSAIPYYYCDYFANLITPLGLVPDFGPTPLRAGCRFLKKERLNTRIQFLNGRRKCTGIICSKPGQIQLIYAWR